MNGIRMKILMALTIGILLSGCSNVDKDIKFYNNKFQITKPARWMVLNNLNDEADVQMGNLFKEAYLIVFSESKLDFDNLDIHGYSELTRGFIRNSLKNYREVSGPKRVTNGDLQGIQYEIAGSINHVRIKYLHTTLEGREHFHQVVAWSTNSRYDSNLLDYNRTISSFKEL